MSSGRTGAYISVILAMMFWGFTFVLYKYANESFRPVSIIFLRLFISIFFLFGFALLLNRLKRIRKTDWKWLLLLSLFEPFFYFLGEVNGMTLVTPTVGAVIISTIPLIVPFAAYYFYRERLTLLNQIGLVVSFAGVLMVVFTRNEGLSADARGILLMCVAVVSAVGYTMVVKKLIDHYNPITITAYQSLCGLVMFLPLFLILEVPRLQTISVSTPSLLALLYLGVIGSGICFILLTIAIRELGASRANIFANLVPVVAAILSFLLLKESMPLLKIAGILVVIAGLFMSQIGEIRLKKAPGKDAFKHPPYA
ncbi:MAG TPA: DMT family transporter [Bacteroides sp.]|nr:DMT family transporter [Bacteroides sp.]